MTLARTLGMDRRARVTAGTAGLIAIALTAVTIALSTLPDVTAPGATAAVARWLGDPSTGAGARVAIAASALSYVPMIVFLAGICRAVAEWGPAEPWKTVATIAAPLFLAGAVTSDAMAWCIPLVVDSAPGITVPIGLVAVADRAWLIALVEAHVALATLALAATIAGMAARGRGARVPIVVLVLGAVGALAVIPLVLFPTSAVVFLFTNQLRLAWLIVFAIWLIARRGELANGGAVRSATS